MTRRSLGDVPRLAMKLARLMRRAPYRRGLRKRVAAAIEHERVPFGHRFATVVDVGAGRGQFALFAATRFPGARIYCFEPLPRSRAALETVVRDLRDTTVVAVAAGARAETAAFHETADGDSSSLHAPGALQAEAFPGTEEVATIEVPTARLDEALPVDQLARPVLLKIDVQGAELEALEGAEGLLAHVDEILVECSFVELYEGQALAGDVVCHLAERGFVLRGLFSPSLAPDGSWLQADLLFAPTRR